MGKLCFPSGFSIYNVPSADFCTSYLLCQIGSETHCKEDWAVGGGDLAWTGSHTLLVQRPSHSQDPTVDIVPH